MRLVSYLRLSFYFLRSFGPLFEYIVRVGAGITVRHLQAPVVQLLIQWPLRFERVLRNVPGPIVDFLDFYVDVLIKLGIIGNAWYARWHATLRTAILGLAEDEVVRVQYCLLIQRRRPRGITLQITISELKGQVYLGLRGILLCHWAIIQRLLDLLFM